MPEGGGIERGREGEASLGTACGVECNHTRIIEFMCYWMRRGVWKSTLTSSETSR